MGKSKLIKRIENISIGVLVISCILSVIFLNSKAIDEPMKRQFLTFFAVEVVFVLVFEFALHWKDNENLEEILSVNLPMDPKLLETAINIASRQSVLGVVSFVGFIFWFVLVTISFIVDDMGMVIMLIYYVVPLFVIPKTLQLIIDLKMHRVKSQIIPEGLQKIKPSVQKKVLFINYMRDLLVLIFIVIGGYQLSLSQVDEWTWPLYDKYSQINDFGFGVQILIIICLIWEWVLKHQDPKEPEAN